MSIEKIFFSSYFVTLILVGITSTCTMFLGFYPKRPSYKRASYYFAAALSIPTLIGSLFMTLQIPQEFIQRTIITSILFVGVQCFKMGYAYRGENKKPKFSRILLHYVFYIFGIVLILNSGSQYTNTYTIIFVQANFIAIALTIFPLVKHVSRKHKPSGGEIVNYVALSITIVLLMCYPIAHSFAESRLEYLAFVLPLQVIQVYIWIIAILILMLSDLAEIYRKQATTDSLTQLSNRAHFFELVGESFSKFKNSSIVFCDIDFFKKINDNYGHHVGDEVLIAFAMLLNTKIEHSSAIIGRIGGEEFGIFLPDTSVEDSYQIIEKLRESIERIELHCDSNHIKVTASFGLAIVKSNIDEALKQADNALYVAKNYGRNQVQIAT